MEHGIMWRAEDSAQELAYRYHVETVPALRTRWQALWLLRQGYTRSTVVQLVGVHPRTLRDWIAWYQIGGCAEVARHRRGAGNGQVCRLTDEQLAELAAWAVDGAFYTYEDAQHWIADMWQIDYTYDGVRSLLNRIGIYPGFPVRWPVTRI